MTSRCVKTAGMLLIVVLLAGTFTVPAEAGVRRNFLEDRVQASIGWRGNRTFSFLTPANEIIDASLQGGFEFTVSYRPARYLYTGFVFSNYASSHRAEVLPSGFMSRSRLGITGFIATPWAIVSKNYSYWHYRGRIGMVVDVTGFESKLYTEQARDITLGRLREHRIFASIESGLKCFGRGGSGVLFIRLSYVRSIYAFSASGSSQKYDFDSSANNHIFFDIGISI